MRDYLHNISLRFVSCEIMTHQSPSYKAFTGNETGIISAVVFLKNSE